jgi:hypothetical protein
VPLDVLPIINELNNPTIIGPNGALPLPPPTPTFQKPFYDVNGDNFVSTLDALIVINHLNALAGEGESSEVKVEKAIDASSFMAKPFPALSATLAPAFKAVQQERQEDSRSRLLPPGKAPGSTPDQSLWATKRGAIEWNATENWLSSLDEDLLEETWDDLLTLHAPCSVLAKVDGSEP